MRRDVLMLQGPIGPFFARFAEGLEQRGFRVWKINFNGGDSLFWRRERAIDYTGGLEYWERYLERLVVNRRVGRIYLFGDCRSYHRIARGVARRHNVRVFVFEEGYIRPNFITLEEDGVNGHSPMIADPVRLDRQVAPLPPELSVPRHVFWFTAVFSMAYYWACAFTRARYPHYRHHRPIGWFSEGLRWLRSGARKVLYRVRERRVMDTLLPQFDGNYFVCPLQVHCDMQVVVHSEFNSIEHFIGEVLASFATHAPPNKAIVFKHHPLDRAYTDYTSLFANLAAELGLQDRVFYVHDLDLPKLLRSAQGTVLINSTVGLSSLFHNTPVKTLGRAVYDLPGLTVQRALDEFWSAEERVDTAAFETYRANLVARNQINGNLYRRISTDDPAGIVWSARLLAEHSHEQGRPDVAELGRLTLVEGGQGSGSRRRKGPKAA